MVTQVPAGGLTSVEQSLVQHVGRGEWLDLTAGDEVVDEAAMRSWGKSRTVSAIVIRDVLRGRLAPDPDPHGLRLRGARITGRLDLENLTTDVNLWLQDCLLEEGIIARGARVADLFLDGCQIEHPTEPPLDGAALACRMLRLVRVKNHRPYQGRCGPPGRRPHRRPVQLPRGEPAERRRPALSASGLHVEQSMFLDAWLRDWFTATGSSIHGVVNLVGAHIDGQFKCALADLRNDSGPALSADGLHVGQHMFLTGGFTGRGRWSPTVDLTGARVGGIFNFRPSRLKHEFANHRLAVDGLTYIGVPSTNGAEVPVRRDSAPD